MAAIPTFVPSFWDANRPTKIFVPPDGYKRAGRYLFNDRPQIRRNGTGHGVRSQFSNVVWTWSQLPVSDFRWWTDTLLLGEISKQFIHSGGSDSGDFQVATTRIENQYGEFVIVSSLIVHAPTFEPVNGNYYSNVKIEFTHIVLL